MRHTLYSIIIMIGIFFFASCQKKGTANNSKSDKKEIRLSKFTKNYPDFNPEHFNSILKEKIQNDSVLLPLYIKNEFKPIWVHDTLDSKEINILSSILSNSTNHGLPDDYFPTDYISSLINAIDSGKYSTNLDTLYQKISDLELMSTRVAMKYIIGMNYGFTDPLALFPKDYDIITKKPDSLFIADLYEKLHTDPIDIISKSHPEDILYKKLLAEYTFLESLNDSELKKIKSTATYKLGDKNPHISEIAHRLMLTNEYTPDSTSSDSLYQILNEDLLAAINNFRLKNSYPEDKEVGQATIEALNRPLDYYKQKLRANMERYRWRRSKDRKEKHIEVNIAPAMLFATQKDSLPLIMKVCVGSVSNKTPLLESDINYLNLNPTWNVPTSIAQKEVAVLQKKDPTYIKRHNMKIFKGGKEIDVESINWSDITPSKFSYTIRQNSGAGNALGLIKFMFNNAFSVYLHDTPSKSAFNRRNRAVSHGCVRVQKPFDLAFFCMDKTDNDIYKDRLYYSINRPLVSKEGKQLMKEGKLKKLPDILNPEEKISLTINYYTTYMYPNDAETVYYADDIYNYDTIILDALDKNSSIKKK